MFKITFSDNALELIYEKNKNVAANDLDKLVVAIFYYSGGSWTLSFCGNVLELVEKQKIHDDSEFIQWTEFEEISLDYPNVEVYIEKELLPELNQKNLILIDAVIGKGGDGETFGLLFMKKEKDVYG